MKLEERTMKETQMLLQVVMMNMMIDIKLAILATIKVEQFVDPVPACHHLYIVVEYHVGDSKGDDYLSAGQRLLFS